MAQSHGSNLWREPAGSGAVPTATHIVLRKDTDGAWIHAAATDAQGIACDPGDGSATIFDLTGEYFAINDGAGGFTLSHVGPAAAVLVDDGAGGFVLTPIGPGVVPAGRFLPDSSGNVYPIRLDALELQFVSVGGVVRTY
jgi:hypothetical protein